MAANTLYRAEIKPGYGSVDYIEFEVLRATPKGYWIQHAGKEKWTSGRFASLTKEKALERLERRTLSYVRRSYIDLVDALCRLKDLGLEVPESTATELEGARFLEHIETYAADDVDHDADIEGAM